MKLGFRTSTGRKNAPHIRENPNVIKANVLFPRPTMRPSQPAFRKMELTQLMIVIRGLWFPRIRNNFESFRGKRAKI
jgi:hypothetical protein